MIDEDDEQSSTLGDMMEALLPRVLAALGQTPVPFDCHRVVTFNPAIFGGMGTGPWIGCNAEFSGGTVTDHDTGEERELPATIGTIVGHAHDRMILAFETDEGVAFLGWVDQSDFDFITIFIPEPQKWMH